MTPVLSAAGSAKLRRATILAHILDDAFVIPGTKFRIGIDAIIGIIPGIGDLIGGVLSLYIIGVAVQLGLPRPTILRMILNVLIEVVLGSVPIIGDAFDAVWKANLRNVKLAEGAIAAAQPRRRRDLLFLLIVVALVFLILLSTALLTLWILVCIKDWITGV